MSVLVTKIVTRYWGPQMMGLRRPVPFPLVLGCSCSLVGVDAESSEVVQETPHPLFSLPPHTAHALHQFPEHQALRQSRTLRTRHKSREQDPPPASSCLDALTSRLDKRVQMGNPVAGAVALSPTNEVSQEPVAGSAQCRSGNRAGCT